MARLFGAKSITTSLICIVFGTAASSILELRDDNFQSILTTHPVVAIAVYNDACEHCERFNEKWEQVFTITF